MHSAEADRVLANVVDHHWRLRCDYRGLPLPCAALHDLASEHAVEIKGNRADCFRESVATNRCDHCALDLPLWHQVLNRLYVGLDNADHLVTGGDALRPLRNDIALSPTIAQGLEYWYARYMRCSGRDSA